MPKDSKPHRIDKAVVMKWVLVNEPLCCLFEAGSHCTVQTDREHPVQPMLALRSR